MQDWTPGELLNILTYDIATYTRVNIEKMADSQVRLDGRSDHSRLRLGYPCRKPNTNPN